jgi:hypothetical protein
MRDALVGQVLLDGGASDWHDDGDGAELTGERWYSGERRSSGKRAVRWPVKPSADLLHTRVS